MNPRIASTGVEIVFHLGVHRSGVPTEYYLMKRMPIRGKEGGKDGGHRRGYRTGYRKGAVEQVSSRSFD